MNRALVYGIVCGGLSAALMLLLARTPFGIVFAYVTPLPVFFAGLTHGVLAAALAALVGTALAVAVDGWMGVIYLALFAAVPVILVRQALLARPVAGDGPEAAWEWYPAGPLVGWLAGIALAAFAVAVLAASGTEGGLPGLMAPVIDKVVGAMQVGQQNQAELVALASRWMAALVAASWMVMMAVNGALAQFLARRLGLARRPAPAFADLDLPGWLAPAMAVGLVVGWLGNSTGYLGWTVALVCGIAFFLQGMALLHWLMRKGKLPAPVLGLVYVLLLVFGGLAPLIAMLGLFEEWARFRRRQAAAPDNAPED